MNRVLRTNQEVFRDELGCLSDTTVRIEIDSATPPKFYRPRQVPHALREKVEEELFHLQKAGIIEAIQYSDWAAPIVPVLKQDGSIRICGDYKLTVNRAAKLDSYPIPRVEDLFARLAGGQSFTTLDMSRAYQQLRMDEESKNYTTINTHKGLFRYRRLPFGIASAPGIFQRTMDNLLQGIPGVMVYLDDILVTGHTNLEHLHNLETVLQRLRLAGLRLKKEKCRFMQTSVKYLGHIISASGLQPATERITAISMLHNQPIPQN